MDEGQFWATIETAWQAVGGNVQARQKLAEKKLSQERAEELVELSQEVVPALRDQLNRLSADELLAFDRILERKLFEIDRAEIQAHTDGSDDGFLYSRGFIVAAGQAYYNAVNARPSVALMDLECEEICYLPWHLYNEKFGQARSSGISRESCSNKVDWPEFN